MGCCGSNKKEIPSVQPKKLAYGNDTEQQPPKSNRVGPEAQEQKTEVQQAPISISELKYAQQKSQTKDEKNNIKLESIDQDQEEYFFREINPIPSKLVPLNNDNNDSIREIKVQSNLVIQPVNDDASTSQQQTRNFKPQDRTQNHLYQQQKTGKGSLLVICAKEENLFQPSSEYDLVEDHFKLKLSNSKVSANEEKLSDNNDEFEVL